MTQNISRRGVWPVKLGTEHSTEITNGNLHCVRCCTFGLARYVDGRPAKHKRDGWVDADRSEKGANVGDAWARIGVLVGEQDDVPDDSDGRGDDDEQPTAFVFL